MSGNNVESQQIVQTNPKPSPGSLEQPNNFNDVFQKQLKKEQKSKFERMNSYK